MTKSDRKPAPPSDPLPRRRALLEDEFLEDLRYWLSVDPKIADRALRIVEETLRTPFLGIGKPEPLKRSAGNWSRRLTGEHRIVYRVTRDSVDFLQARFHYDD